MTTQNTPDSSAVRVALWRALHLEVDAPPPVLNDEIGLKLVAPEEGWRRRPDMHPEGTRGYRASIVGRARFVEDLVHEKLGQGVTQYVILGAGLDSFVQRRRDLAGRMKVFEIDKPATQDWKRSRLKELGLAAPIFVPVDFEAGESWREKLFSAGFDSSKPAIIASTGVSMYLTRNAVESTLSEIARFAPGSVLAMTFLLPLELIAAEERAQHQAVYDRAKAAGTPFMSFFSPKEMLALARDAGFRQAEQVSTEELIQRYFSGRTDGLRPSTGESILVART